MASLKEKLQQSFIEDNPAMGVLRGIKSAFAGADEVESTNLRGLSSEERIAKLRGSIDQNLPTSGSLFGEEIGGFVADLPQGSARVASFAKDSLNNIPGSEFLPGPLGSISTATKLMGSGNGKSNQFLFGQKEAPASELPELGEQEWGIDAEAHPILAGLAGTVAVGLETPFGKPFKTGGKAVKELVKDMEFESVSKKLRDMFKSLDDSELDELSQTISQSNNSGVVSKALTDANFNNVVRSSGNAAIRRGADADLVQGNVSNVVIKGGDVDANGYVDVYISGTPDQIKQLRASGDPTGLLASIKKSKTVSDDIVFTKVKVPGEDISFKLGDRVALSEGAISRSLGVTDSKIAKSASNITDDAARLEIEDTQDVIRSLSTAGSKASENKLATVNKVRNSLDEIARKYAGSYQSIQPAIQAATTPRQFKSILQDIAQGVESGTITPSSKVRSIMAKANKAQVGNVKAAIRKETGQIKDHELSLLNEQIQRKANKAMANKSAKELVVAKELFESVNSSVKKNLSGPKVKVADTGSTAKHVDMYLNDGKLLGVFKKDVERGESVGQYALGKSAQTLRTIMKPAELAVDKMSKLKLTDVQREELFAYRESKDISKLESFTKEEIALAKEADEQITEVTNVIGDYLVDFGLLKEKGNAETYNKVYLRNLDGTPASAANIASLRNSMSDTNFTELMSSYSQSISKSSLKKNRKYATAEERDEFLKLSGLKTDKDIERVFNNYVDGTSQIIGKETMSRSIREVAKAGVRDDLVEIFDPKILSQQRKEMSQGVIDIRKELMAELKEIRGVSGASLRAIKESKKNFDMSTRDLPELSKDVNVTDMMNVDARQIDEIFDDVYSQFSSLPDKAKKAIEYKVDLARKQSKAQLKGLYDGMSIKYGKLSDKGLSWISGRNAPALRGVMGAERDVRFVDEIFQARDKNTAAGLANEIFQRVKLFQATADAFSIPRAYYMAAGLTNPVKAAKIWKTSAVPDSVSEELLTKASEFVLMSRQTIGDVDTLKRIQGDVESQMSNFQKMVNGLDEFTDINMVAQTKDAIATGIRNLEKWQYDVLWDQAKAQAWEVRVKSLMAKGIPEREAQIEAGRLIDTLTGAMDFDKIMAKYPRALSKNVQTALRLTFFAPNLTMTTFRMAAIYGPHIFSPGARGVLARRAAINTIVAGNIVAQAMSYAFNGHSTFENENPDKFLAVKLPFKDEKGNDFYLNPLGWLPRPFELMNKPLASLKGKIGGLSRFAMNLLVEDPYDNPADSRVAKAMSGVLPVPFTLQDIVSYGKAQFTDEPQYGVAENGLDQVMITAAEFFGFEGVFTGDGGQTTTAAKIIREISDGIENNKELDHLLTPEMVGAYAFSKKMLDKKDIYKARYDISGRTTDDEFLEAVKKMDPEAQRDFLSSYADSTQKQIKRDLRKINSSTGSEGLLKSVPKENFKIQLKSADPEKKLLKSVSKEEFKKIKAAEQE